MRVSPNFCPLPSSLDLEPHHLLDVCSMLCFPSHRYWGGSGHPWRQRSAKRRLLAVVWGRHHLLLPDQVVCSISMVPPQGCPLLVFSLTPTHHISVAYYASLGGALCTPTALSLSWDALLHHLFWTGAIVQNLGLEPTPSGPAKRMALSSPN